MTVSHTPSCVAERRLAIARRIFQALAAQDPNRVTNSAAGAMGKSKVDNRKQTFIIGPTTLLMWLKTTGAAFVPSDAV